MKWILKGAAVGLACWGMMVPSTSAHAAEPVKADSVNKTAKKVVTAKIADVTLHKGGLAAGKVVDGQGNNVANLPVSIRHEGKTVLQVKTRNDGTWIARGLKGGLHQVAVGRDQQVVRLWAPKTAPPTAKNFSTLVVSGKVVRGQDGYYYDPGYDQGYVESGYADGGACPPGTEGGGGACGLGGCGLGGVDVITLATVGASAAALVFAIDNKNSIDDLEDQAAAAPQSP